VLGNVGDDGLPCSLDYSFDRLAVTSNGNLFYVLSDDTFSQVTDPNLGHVFDVLFIDGRFMLTDGTSLILTDLTDPTVIDPLMYGSAEEDPDPIMAICKVRGEVYALGQYTIQNYQDVGGAGFPFSNNVGGIIPRGIVGRKAWTYFNETFAFLGGDKRERPSVYIAGAGESKSISTTEVQKLLAALTAGQLADVALEVRNDQNDQRLFMHLPDRTLCYMNQTSLATGTPVWITLREGDFLDQPYSARHLTFCQNLWMVATADGRVGVVDEANPAFWGEMPCWSFQTDFLYNASRGAIVHRVELVGLPGRAAFGADPVIFLSTTTDGETWSQEQAISGGRFGERGKRLVWWPNRRFAAIMGLRFRGVGEAHSSFTRLEVEVEPLAA
jgi:hypothetical protein